MKKNKKTKKILIAILCAVFGIIAGVAIFVNIRYGSFNATELEKILKEEKDGNLEMIRLSVFEGDNSKRYFIKDEEMRKAFLNNLPKISGKINIGLSLKDDYLSDYKKIEIGFWYGDDGTPKEKNVYFKTNNNVNYFMYYNKNGKWYNDFHSSNISVSKKKQILQNSMYNTKNGSKVYDYVLKFIEDNKKKLTFQDLKKIIINDNFGVSDFGMYEFTEKSGTGKRFGLTVESGNILPGTERTMKINDTFSVVLFYDVWIYNKSYELPVSGVFLENTVTGDFINLFENKDIDKFME